MKKIVPILVIFFLAASYLYANDELKSISFDNYLKKFDNKERRDMKIRIPELLELYKQNKVQIIDIRTSQEYECII